MAPPGVAVSQDVTVGSIEGQAWDEMIANMRWDTAADRRRRGGRAGCSPPPPTEPALVNVNVPNLPIDEIKGWRHTELALLPGRAFSGVTLEAEDRPRTCVPTCGLRWGEPIDLPIESDTGAVQAGLVSITWLGRVEPVPPDRDAGVIGALTEMMGPAQDS